MTEEITAEESGTYNEYKIIVTGIYKWAMALVNKVYGKFRHGSILWR